MQSNFSQVDIENAITDQDVSGLRIIYFAMFLGVLFLLVAVYFISQIYTTPTVSMNTWIYFVLAFFTLTFYYAFARVGSIVLSPKKLKMIKSQKDTSEKTDFFMEKMLARMYIILRAAVLEGAALISCVALFLSARQGLLAHQKLYWLFVLPSLVHFAFIIFYFPNKAAIARIISFKILSQ